jgi:Transposase
MADSLDEHDAVCCSWVKGRGAEALRAFAEAVLEHGADPSQIEAIAMDMSPAYVSLQLLVFYQIGILIPSVATAI